MKHLLITGFAPFGGETVNPSWEAVRRLPDVLGGVVLHKKELPVEFTAAADLVWAETERLRPDAVLCVGQAGGRDAVTPEYVAINLRHARIADNAGNHPQDEPVVLGGPAAYFTTVPVRRMVEAVEKTGVPCACSYTAGTFVCNDLIYSLLHALRDTEIPAGFIHVPFLPEQGSPSLTLEQMVAALTAAVSAL
jgi:pyroglutamyl-peptidase